MVDASGQAQKPSNKQQQPPGAWRTPPQITLLEGSAFGPHIGRVARFGAAMEWRHMRQMRERHYYIRDVGVLPDMQGQGLGSALMRPTLERCDRQGLPAYIEASSERSAALYERLGFQLIRELRVGSSPPLRLMLRPPHPARRRDDQRRRVPLADALIAAAAQEAGVDVLH